MGLLALKGLDAGVQLKSLAVGSLALLFEALAVLLVDLLEHLVVAGLGVALAVEVHLLLQLEGLLELLLQLFQVGLGLVALGLQELEAAFPEGSLFVKQIALLLQLSLRSIKLSSKLLVAIGIVDL